MRLDGVRSQPRRARDQARPPKVDRSNSIARTSEAKADKDVHGAACRIEREQVVTPLLGDYAKPAKLGEQPEARGQRVSNTGHALKGRRIAGAYPWLEGIRSIVRLRAQTRHAEPSAAVELPSVLPPERRKVVLCAEDNGCGPCGSALAQPAAETVLRFRVAVRPPVGEFQFNAGTRGHLPADRQPDHSSRLERGVRPDVTVDLRRTRGRSGMRPPVPASRASAWSASAAPRRWSTASAS